MIASSLWQENVIDAGKLPLFMCMLAFVVTFIVTRIIVRMIRSGKGPFKDNSVGGVHVHHMVPGIILLIIGGFMALGNSATAWRGGGGVLFGIGLALVLDEFALVLHLEDVYWEQAGRLSVDIVFIVAAVMGLIILVGSPFGLGTSHKSDLARLLVTLGIAIQLVFVIITAMKGKIMTAVAGVFVFAIAVIGAIRLARPHSPWARKRYREDSEKMATAIARDVRIEKKYRSKVYWLQDAVAGVGDSDPDRTH